MANYGPSSGISEIELKVLGGKSSSSVHTEMEPIPNLPPQPQTSLLTPMLKPTASLPITIPGKEGQLQEDKSRKEKAKEKPVSTVMSKSLPTQSTLLPLLSSTEEKAEEDVLGTSYRSRSFVPQFTEKTTVDEKNPLLRITQKGDGETGLVVGRPGLRDGCPERRSGFF